jgi:hypothetical protein
VIRFRRYDKHINIPGTKLNLSLGATLCLCDVHKQADYTLITICPPLHPRNISISSGWNLFCASFISFSHKNIHI